MIITIAHDKGGTGKSLTCLNLLATLKPDIAIDLDTRKDLTMLNNDRPENKRFNVIGCDNVKALISQLKQSDQGKLIIVDCGGFDSELTSIAITAADLVITPCNGTTTERNGLKSFSRILARQSKKANRTIKGYILLNRTDPRRKDFSIIDNFIEGAPNLTRLKSVISSRKIITDSAEFGLSVAEINNKSVALANAKIELNELTNELKELL
jgi:chromosome partitioning protein